MIVSFRHKGLKELYEEGNRRYVQPVFAAKLERILARLDEATVPGDMNLPGLRLHPLRGDRAGYWAVSVSDSWRVIFGFDGEDVCHVDLDDYH
ncbi:MAG: type II toxin-antitoxin system RelE/ParE family toxin [Gemmatimonadota bacterium]|nr:type II toxin-antitoxin system RelE/ParE family toxin [Gemmatimonadota bacterium]